MSELMIVFFAIILVSVIVLLYTVFFVQPALMDEMYKESAVSFSKAIEMRTSGLYGTSHSFIVMCGALAKSLKLKPYQIRRLAFAAYLRDIGLSSIPHHIINNPINRTAVETITFNRHAEISASMLRNSPQFNDVAEIVLYHHARYDGADTGLSSSDIPIESRILAVVSAYFETLNIKDADTALQIIAEGSGAAFDPIIVTTFMQLLGRKRPIYAQSSASVVSEEREMAIAR